MKPRFEEHEGQLFRMLEKPVPLTPDAELPCLVRLIQDDSPMGMFNKWNRNSLIGIKMIVEYLGGRGNMFLRNDHINFCEHLGSHYAGFEIIGYPVEDGSRWWALYQMMQGKKVSHKDVIRNECCALNQDGNVQYYDMDNPAYIGTIRSKLEFGKKDVVKTGWQIYKEPELKYKVGDWVEIESSHTKGKTFVSVIKEMPKQEHYTVRVNSYFGGYTVYGIMERQIVRKLKPSEVIVRIGCLEGTVEDLSYADNGRFFLIGKATERHPVGMYSILYDEMLDSTTRELVEDLLKAQEEK